MSEFKHSLNEPIETQLLIESTKKGRPQSPVPDDKEQDFTSPEGPHEVRSLSIQNNNIKATSPNQLVVFPPEIPPQYRTYSRSKSPTPQLKNETTITTEPAFTTTFKNLTENITSQSSDKYLECVDFKYLPKFHGIKGPISMAMEIAPDRPFTPVNVTEPIIKSTPWISLPSENEDRPESPFVAALKTAPERSYSPLPTFVYASELEPTQRVDPTRESKKPISKTETFEINQNFNFRPSELKTSRPIGNNPVRYMHGYNNKTPNIPIQNNQSYSQSVPAINTQKEQIASLGFKPISLSNDKSLITGPYEPVESKSNYNETFITHVGNFEKSNKCFSEYSSSTSNHNVTLNTSKNQHNLPNIQHLSVSNCKPTHSRSIGPGIKNKVTTFTPTSLNSDVPFLKKQSNGHNISQSLENKFTSTVGSSYDHKSNNPKAVKLMKAVPFFSNSTSIPSSPKFTPTNQSPKEFSS